MGPPGQMLTSFRSPLWPVDSQGRLRGAAAWSRCVGRGEKLTTMALFQGLVLLSLSSVSLLEESMRLHPGGPGTILAQLCVLPVCGVHSPNAPLHNLG